MLVLFLLTSTLQAHKQNGLLARYSKKIGPDPASINAAMIGGIAANNASGNVLWNFTKLI